jgi:ribonuclease BN (tRNA processing enzyme)
VNLFRENKQEGFTFLLGNEEKEAFLQILQQYPRVPEAHLRVTKSANLPKADEIQRLLSEALAEQRAENRKGVQLFLSQSGRFEQIDRGWLLTLSLTELDWLLQILNDVRVGSWVGLGAPEPRVEIRKMDDNAIRNFWDMEIAGHFQSALLGALKGQNARLAAKEAAKVCSLKCFGTGDGWPSADRNHSSFLYRFGNTRLLIDCGEGASRSYKASGLSYDAVDAIFLSHMHADHIGGFLMLMQGFWLEKRRKALPVYMPGRAIPPMKEMLKTALIYDALLRFRMQMLALKAAAKTAVKTVRITAFPTTHLDGLRKKFSKASAARFSAFCFLLEHKKLRIGHSADIGRPEDLDPLFAKPLDVLVCELAHFTPQKILHYLRGKPVKRLIFIHLGRDYRPQLAAIRKMAQEALPNTDVLFPDDGDEITF